MLTGEMQLALLTKKLKESSDVDYSILTCLHVPPVPIAEVASENLVPVFSEPAYLLEKLFMVFKIYENLKFNIIFLKIKYLIFNK